MPLNPSTFVMPTGPDYCNDCGFPFEDAPDGGTAERQSRKKRRWLATIKDGVVVQECCKRCAKEYERLQLDDGPNGISAELFDALKEYYAHSEWLDLDF